MPGLDQVKAACEACFEAHEDDCSGFARAVAAAVGVTLNGQANDIVDTMAQAPGWTRLPDGGAAAQAAQNGRLVLGGLKGSDQSHPSDHGHVVIVVGPPLAHAAYPSAYWGKLGGGGRKDTTINWAWNVVDRNNVIYAAHDF